MAASLLGFGRLSPPAPIRQYSQINTGINFVPQQEAWVVERMGKFKKILEPVIGSRDDRRI